MQYSAHLRNAPVSAQKCRLVADVIRGLTVQRATDLLDFPNRKTEVLFRKLLNSAIANAENNFGADIDRLKVETVYVNEGLRFKRFRPRARGRGAGYKKHHCNISVMLSDGRDSAPGRAASPAVAAPEAEAVAGDGQEERKDQE